MKRIINLKAIIILGTIFFTSTAFSYNTANKGERCKAPKYSSIVPPVRSKGGPVPEVEAESEISFSVSNVNPSTIKVVAKKLRLKPEIVDRDSNYLVTVKLPAELNGQFARIELSAKARAGMCESKGGWLIKIKDVAETAEDSGSTKK